MTFMVGEHQSSLLDSRILNAQLSELPVTYHIVCADVLESEPLYMEISL